MSKAQVLEDRLIDFAVRIVKAADAMPRNFGGQHFYKQIIRSGSAPALLYAEARGSESDSDFKHKCSLTLKELRETYVNLKIVSRVGYLSDVQVSALITENNELISIFVATLRTVKKRLEESRGKGSRKGD